MQVGDPSALASTVVKGMVNIKKNKNVLTMGDPIVSVIFVDVILELFQENAIEDGSGERIL